MSKTIEKLQTVKFALDVYPHWKDSMAPHLARMVNDAIDEITADGDPVDKALFPPHTREAAAEIRARESVYGKQAWDVREILDYFLQMIPEPERNP